jgi:hypothetical protein
MRATSTKHSSKSALTPWSSGRLAPALPDFLIATDGMQKDHSDYDFLIVRNPEGLAKLNRTTSVKFHAYDEKSKACSTLRITPWSSARVSCRLQSRHSIAPRVTNGPLTQPQRLLYIAQFAVSTGLLAFGLYLQHVVGVEPCPMCIM